MLMELEWQATELSCMEMSWLELEVVSWISACDKARGLGCAINACEMECAGEAHDGQCFSCDESPKEIGAQDGPAGRAGQFVVCFGGDDFGLSSVALRNMDDHNIEYVKK